MFLGLEPLVGSFFESNAAGTAAEQQAAANRDAMAMQERMYNQQRADHQPWREAGVRALGGMEDKDFQRDFTMSDFQADPGYAFRMQQGQKAIERSKAAKGLLGSGGTLKALNDYGQNMGAQEYQSSYDRFNADRDRRFGRLAQISGMGQNAAGQMSGAAQNYGNNASNLMINHGDNQASATMAKTKAWTDGFQQVQNNAKDMASIAMGMGSGGGAGGWMNKWRSNQGK